MKLSIAKNLDLPVEALTQTFAILAKRGVGKALALDTPLPTADGWTTMGNIRVGEVLFDERGHSCRVTYVAAVQKDRECFRITFSDGASIIADAEHLWLTESLASRRADGQRKLRKRRGGAEGRPGRPQCQRRIFPEMITTAQIRKTLTVTVGQRLDLNHAVPTCGELRCVPAELPIDPYVLGIWLGDGTAQNSYITTSDDDVLHEIREAGYSIGKATNPAPSGKSASYRIGSCNGIPLHKSLRLLNLLNNKRVPPIYLRASAEQRRDLLAGLMDSDGTIGTKSNLCTFNNKNARLADAVYEIVVSLGWQARRSVRRAKLYGKDCGLSHGVSFRPTAQIFRLPRKASRLNFNVTQESRASRRMIVSVDPVPSVPVCCIAVDSPSRLYLAGHDCIPTHNTYAALVMTEEFLKNGLPVVVVDPVGVAWGLRVSADGKSKGLPIVIMGGEHGDVPLEPSSGALVADMIVDERFSAVLDLSLLRKGEQVRFMTDFAERLYHRNRNPLHLILDEADCFAPQRPMKGQERMLGAVEDLVRRGRARGLGITLVTQRSAVLNKDVLTQIEVLMPLRTIAPQDREAIDAWVKVHGTTEQRNELMDSLPSLPIGTAWFWSPGWLDAFKRIEVRKRETFDSSATPTVGARPVTPKRFADVDIENLKTKMASTIERAKADDPRELRKKISELEGEVKKAQAAKPMVETREVPVFSDTEVKLFEKSIESVNKLDGTLMAAREKLGEIFSAIRPLISKVHGLRAPWSAPPAALPLHKAIAPAEPKVVSKRIPVEGGVKIGIGEQKILTALAQYPQGRTKKQVAVLTCYAHSGGAFNNYLGALRKKGWIIGSDALHVTEDGIIALGPHEPLPKGDALYQHWLSQLGKAEREILRVLVERYPSALCKEAIAKLAGYEVKGGGFANALGRLRTLELIHGRGDIQAAKEFFE